MCSDADDATRRFTQSLFVCAAHNTHAAMDKNCGISRRPRGADNIASAGGLAAYIDREEHDKSGTRRRRLVRTVGADAEALITALRHFISCPRPARRVLHPAHLSGVHACGTNESHVWTPPAGVVMNIYG